MIKLFITDIDGCLLEPMQTPDWTLLSQIRSFIEQSRHDPIIPSITICTGRPMPYAEAVAQMMDIRNPVVFESAGVFHPEGYHISMGKAFDAQAAEEVQQLKKWLKKHIISTFDGMTPEFSKLMDAGVIHPRQEIIQKALPRVRNYVSEHYPAFKVNFTEVSINIILKNNTKEAGIRKLCRLMEVEPNEVAFIGDSDGDIPGLELTGLSFAPQNATENVKKSVHTTLPASSTKAVLLAIRKIIQINRQQVSDRSNA